MSSFSVKDQQKEFEFNMESPSGDPILANVTKPRSNTFPMHKRASDMVNVRNSPREKLRKAFLKKLVLPEDFPLLRAEDKLSESSSMGFLGQMKIKDLHLENKFESEALILHEHECVSKTIDILFTEKISCVPVMNGGNLVAILDVNDIVIHCCSQLQGEKDPASVITRLEEELSSMPLSKLLSKSNWKSVDVNTSIRQLFAILADKQCERVAILDEGKIVGVLSRRQLMQFLSKFKAELKDKLQLRLSDLQLQITSSSPPSFSEVVCSIFESMWKKQLSGVLAGANSSSCLGKFLNLIQFVHCVVTETDYEDEPMSMEDTLEVILDAMTDATMQTVKIQANTASTDNQFHYLHFYHILQICTTFESS